MKPVNQNNYQLEIQLWGQIKTKQKDRLEDQLRSKLGNELRFKFKDQLENQLSQISLYIKCR